MRRLTLKQFLERSIIIHNGFYDYSNIHEYINCETKLKINCPIHGEFQQRPMEHLIGAGCSKCRNDNTKKRRRNTQETVIQKFKMIHGEIYDYSKVNYKQCAIKVIIVCKKHGEFQQRPSSHLQGYGCKKCSYSRGEKEIARILTKNKINFNIEKRFDGCRNPKTKYMLPFDFYLPDYNCCIEFDGRQHFKPTLKISIKNFTQDEAEKNLKYTKFKDELKNKFCDENGIKLIRVSYLQFREIQEIIENLLKTFSIQ